MLFESIWTLVRIQFVRMQVLFDLHKLHKSQPLLEEQAVAVYEWLKHLYESFEETYKAQVWVQRAQRVLGRGGGGKGGGVAEVRCWQHGGITAQRSTAQQTKAFSMHSCRNCTRTHTHHSNTAPAACFAAGGGGGGPGRLDPGSNLVQTGSRSQHDGGVPVAGVCVRGWGGGGAGGHSSSAAAKRAVQGQREGGRVWGGGLYGHFIALMHIGHHGRVPCVRRLNFHYFYASIEFSHFFNNFHCFFTVFFECSATSGGSSHTSSPCWAPWSRCARRHLKRI
jgi:hypothetical protein